MTTATLTREQILAMPAGAGMDALVAERVMGGVYRDSTPWEKWDEPPRVRKVCDVGGYPLHGSEGDWSPSTDIAAAWEVVEAGDITPETGKRWHYDLHQVICGGWFVDVWDERFAFKGNPRPVELQHICADTAPLAICRAALLATLGSNA